MRDMPVRDGVLVGTDGTTLPISKEAAKALKAHAKDNKLNPQPGDRFPAPTDGGPDPAPAAGPAPVQIWYGDPAKHPNAYLAVTFETPGEVIVRDGEDPTGKAIHFTTEQWASYTDPDWEEPTEGDAEHPAEVTNPNEIYKTPDKPDSQAVHPERA
jgi:hypothetical protein